VTPLAVDPRTPCIIGVAQRTWRPEGAESEAPEPLSMWEEVARAAAADTGRADVLSLLDSAQIVYCQTWPYDDPVGRLCERIGAEPRHRLYSGIGGTTPQVLVNETAEAMLRGDYDLALVTGAEALDTARRVKKRGERLAWSHRDPEKKPFPFEAPFHPAEVAHEVFQAWLTFAVFDVARRAHTGAGPRAHRERLGRLLAPMTEIAARNPHAWFPIVRSAEELITATPQNRMVGYPYTKYMVSVMDVDMAAALIVATHERANQLGIADDKRVYLRSWAYAQDPHYVAERQELWHSPAMEVTSASVLQGAGVGIDEVAHLDLYSCFASSVLFARDALGLSDDDARSVTVTGGLPFSGGAGSDYVTHSIAAMTERLRADPGSFGLVSGVGMHMTKHVYALYSSAPGPAAPPDTTRIAREVDAAPREAIVDTYSGPAAIAAYSVAHGRDGEAQWGLAVCDLPEGGRAYAKMLDGALLAEAEDAELVGSAVELVAGDGNTNIVKR
jgi:acetyl-CoA C-acetyltransferase